jgi:hypothetical protein
MQHIKCKFFAIEESKAWYLKLNEASKLWIKIYHAEIIAINHRVWNLNLIGSQTLLIPRDLIVPSRKYQKASIITNKSQISTREKYQHRLNQIYIRTHTHTHTHDRHNSIFQWRHDYDYNASKISEVSRDLYLQRCPSAPQLGRKLKGALINPTPSFVVPRLSRGGSGKGGPGRRKSGLDDERWSVWKRAGPETVQYRHRRLNIGADNELVFSNQVPHCHPIFIRVS